MTMAALVPTIPVDALLEAYAEGRFPMCHPDGALYWHDPDPRAVFQLDTVEPDARTARMLRSGRFSTSIDRAFAHVVEACADREETWLDDRLIASYIQLHHAGHAHSVEVWEADRLVGGTYGVSLGSAFFAESMFNRVNNAGKVAFHTLVAHLRQRGYTLLDTQYMNVFTKALGAVELRRSTFRRQLEAACTHPITFQE